MQLRSIFSKLNTQITDLKHAEKECRAAIVKLKNNIAKIDEALEKIKQKKSQKDDALAVNSLLLRKRIEEVNKKIKLEKMLAEQPIPHSLLQFYQSLSQNFIRSANSIPEETTPRAARLS